VTRHASANGFHVERRFGWDTHGLPVEHEIDKKLGITGREDVMKMGIDKYNAECRSIVMRYSSEWRATVERMGRWIDFDNDYKTLNLEFMESVWWAFSELFKKGMVYRGLRVMPYSTGCTTPLSNFEAGLDFRDVSDPASELFRLFGCGLVSDTIQLRSPSHWSMTPRPAFLPGRPHRGRCPAISASACIPISTISRFMTPSLDATLFSTKTSSTPFTKILRRPNSRKSGNSRALI
jgi:hypothetical protein